MESYRRGRKMEIGFLKMERNLTTGVNDWWNKFDLIEKILIKDTIINLCNKAISAVKKKKYIEAVRKKIVFKK